MARKSASTIQEELYSTADEPAREELDDARLLDLDGEKESPFLRAQKRVPARRSPLPKKTAARIFWALLAIVIACVFAIAASAFYHYGQHSWRFRLNSSDDIDMAGLSNVTRAQIMEVMGGDIGRNVFFIPLDERQKQLQQIPWVESASVMRFAPDRIKIEIKERTPVAFAQVGSKIMLADAGGVLMELSSKKKYSFPVILGMSSSQPLSTRSAQMKIYNELARELDSEGAHYSQELSEVDLSDPEDVKVLTNDRDGEVLVHLGPSNYLDRYKIYVAHLREWRQQFPRLESVDLRYDRQIIVNPDLHGAPAQAPLSAKAAKAALAAGVKPTALLQHEPAPQTRPAVVHAVAKSSAPTRTGAVKVASKPLPAKHAVSKGHTPAHNAVTHAPSKAKPVAHHAASRPEPHSAAPVSKKSQPSAGKTAGGKPSPAIAKGQDSR
jgi:cell division protein FtsQ